MSLFKALLISVHMLAISIALSSAWLLLEYLKVYLIVKELVLLNCSWHMVLFHALSRCDIVSAFY